MNNNWLIGLEPININSLNSNPLKRLNNNNIINNNSMRYYFDPLLAKKQTEDVKKLFNELKTVLENLYTNYEPSISINISKQFTYLTCYFISKRNVYTNKELIDSTVFDNSDKIHFISDDVKHYYVTHRIIYSSFLKNKLYFQSDVNPLEVKITQSKDNIIHFSNIDLESGSSKRKHINEIIEIFRSHIKHEITTI
jgi:hypothetical protein